MLVRFLVPSIRMGLNPRGSERPVKLAHITIAFNFRKCYLPPELLRLHSRFAVKCSQSQVTLQSARSRQDCGRAMCLLACLVLRQVSSYNKYSPGKSTHGFH